MRLGGTTSRSSTVSVDRLVRLLGDWPRPDASLHGDLTHALRVLIRSGALPSGVRLPSERNLAVGLGMGRNTVAKAFDTLRGDGLLTSRRGDGTYVTYTRTLHISRGGDRLRSFVAEPGEGRVDLRSAALPGLAMVADELNLLDGVRLRGLLATHGYLPSGLPELREAVARYYSDLGLPSGPENILITSGAQQAIRLAALAFVAPGSRVIVEEPCFRGALELFKTLGAEMVSVPSGAQGIDVEALEAAIRSSSPALVLLQSTVHNPTGSVLDSFRRRRVATIATRHRVPIVDDATLADTTLDGDLRPVPLAAGSESILTVGSVSKSFWGGLRVGWLRAPSDLVGELVDVKGGEDLGTSVLAQLLASRLLPKIESARGERFVMLSESRRLVLEAIAEHLPDWEPQLPQGGGSLWVRLPEEVALTLVQRAARDGILLLPGSTFSAEDRLDDYVRLAFTAPPNQVLNGIRTLGQIWRRMRP